MNHLIPFMINDAPVRGRIVRLDTVADSIVVRHNYPLRISELLAETLVVAAMLASNLKSEGILTVQIQSKGPVTLLVVDAAFGGALRGYADFNAAAFEALPDTSLTHLFVDGYLAITLDPGEGGQRYQGIVPLEGRTITETVQNYFTQSQQLTAGFHVTVGRQSQLGETREHWIAGGIYIERLPDMAELPKEEGDEAWNRSRALLGTLRDDEILDVNLPLPALLHRLFHEDGVWVYEPHQIQDRCRCSREKIENTLLGLPADQLAELMEDDEINVHCQFCNTDYAFDSVSLRK